MGENTPEVPEWNQKGFMQEFEPRSLAGLRSNANRVDPQYRADIMTDPFRSFCAGSAVR